MSNQLETSVLRMPLRNFLKEMFDTMCINHSYIYKTARMSPHTYSRVLNGDEPPGSRDRFLIACILQIRQSFDEGIISVDEYITLLEQLETVGGDTVYVAETYSTDVLEDYLLEAYKRSCNRFKSK